MMDLHKINRHRWGIIYSPKPGVVRPMKRWGEIREYLVSRGIEYDFLESENFGSAERQARMFADNGYETIVVVGGDGALQDALNGILSSIHADSVSLGMIPNGIANDFASYWGLQDGDYKAAIDCILARRIRKVDVGCCAYVTENGAEKKYFLNALNIGLAARIVKLANERQTLFAKFVCRITALVYMLFHRRSFDMRFRLNNQVVDGRFMMLCIGNSTGYGLTPSSVPYNGFLDVSAIRKPKLFSMLEGLLMLVHRKILNYELVAPFRTAEIFIESSGGAAVAIDGRPFVPEMPMTVTVEPERLNLIIPTKVNKSK